MPSTVSVDVFRVTAPWRVPRSLLRLTLEVLRHHLEATGGSLGTLWADMGLQKGPAAHPSHGGQGGVRKNRCPLKIIGGEEDTSHPTRLLTPLGSADSEYNLIKTEINNNITKRK